MNVSSQGPPGHQNALPAQTKKPMSFKAWKEDPIHSEHRKTLKNHIKEAIKQLPGDTED